MAEVAWDVIDDAVIWSGVINSKTRLIWMLADFFDFVKFFLCFLYLIRPKFGFYRLECFIISGKYTSKYVFLAF